MFARLPYGSIQERPLAAAEFEDRTYPSVPVPKRAKVFEAVAARISPLVVAKFIPKILVVAVGRVKVPVLVMLEMVGDVRVKPATVVVVWPKVRAVEPRVRPEFASFTLVTFPSLILRVSTASVASFAAVTEESVGVRVFVRRVSVPYTTSELEASPELGMFLVDAVPSPVTCVLAIEINV